MGSEMCIRDSSGSGPEFYATPWFITLDLPQAVPGRVIQVMRTADPDLSSGRGNVDEPVVLSLGEVLINGCALGDVIGTHR